MFGPVRVRKQRCRGAEQALALLDRVGLRERANHYPAELSGAAATRGDSSCPGGKTQNDVI